MSNDRAAVARGVLTEIANAHRELGFTAIVDVMESWRDEHYPAPPAPETVTVGDDVYSRRGDTWYVGGFNIGLTLRHRELLDRIASDARVIQERDARIAELEVELHETRERQLPMVRLRDEAYRQRDAARARIAELENELRRALDGTVFHEKQAYEARTERDAALRALGEKGEGLGGDSRPNGDAVGNSAGQPPQQTPAPIPLGAVVEVENDSFSPYRHDTSGWRTLGRGAGGYVVQDNGWGHIITALYHARHPVATRETVERVALAVRDADLSRSYLVPMHVYHKLARAALTAAGFTLEEGA